MRHLRSVLLLCLLLVALPLLRPVASAAPETVTILFTHDLHSHLLPELDEAGQSYGGYARLKTAIDQQKALHPEALLVDGGDFSMGSLFQTAYATDALELRMMGALGYDVVTFGNHEYDYRAAGLAAMLTAALDSGDPLPTIVQANYPPDGADAADAAAVREAFDRYGVADYTVVTRGGVHFAVFGLMGLDADECAPLSGMALADPIATASAVVAQIEAEVPEPRVVVCLSHGGTSSKAADSEDEQLAAQVDGIDVIVSGHTHTTLPQPLQVGNTWIVSVGEYCHNLGVLTLTRGDTGCTLASYELIPIDDTLPEDEAIADRVAQYKGLVEQSYLSQFGGLSFDQVIAQNPYVFESLTQLGEMHGEAALGNLIADAYRWAVEQAEGDEAPPVDFALTANGVIRASLPTGALTVSDVFNVASLGIGADGVPGYPLVSVWITGADLKNAFEVDASVTALMPAAQLYFTGMAFTFNPHRMIFNKVTDSAQVLADGTSVPIDDDRLYRVVTGLYCGQMLGAVNDQSFGILTITPRDAEGNAITDLEAYIVHDPAGNELKEWYALASYLAHLETIPARYSAPEGRKVSAPSWNPIALLKHPNGITLAVLGLLLALIAAVVLVVWRLRRRRRRRRAQAG